MKKGMISAFICLSCLSSCSLDSNTFSFEEATGVEVNNILNMSVSPGVAVSVAWPYYGDYSFLETKYIKEKFNFYDEFFNISDQNSDDAIILRATTDILLETYPPQNYSPDFFISKNTHYLYCGCDGDFSYRSLNKISQETIDELLNYDSDDSDSYALTTIGTPSNISPDFPPSYNYKKGTKIRFRVLNVTDVDFYVYLNNERLNYYKDDGFIGGYKYYEFIMPDYDSTLALSSDKFYVDREYNFNEIFYWVNSLNKSNVKGIRIKEGNNVNPESEEPTTIYSDDERDISYNLNVLNEPLKKVDKEIISDGNYQNVTFILENNEYTIQLIDGNIFWNDFSTYQYFRFDRTPTITFGISYPKSE